MSVKFTDDNGISEGAVDLGGPMREFFTLILDHLHSSQLFCGLENHRLLSYQSKCIQDDEYFIAGTIMACPLYMEGPLHSFFRP